MKPRLTIFLLACVYLLTFFDAVEAKGKKLRYKKSKVRSVRLKKRAKKGQKGFRIRKSTRSLLKKIHKSKRSRREADAIARLLASKRKRPKEVQVRINALARRLKFKDNAALHEAIALHYADMMSRLQRARSRSAADRADERRFSEQRRRRQEDIADQLIDEAKEANRGAKEAFKTALAILKEMQERQSQTIQDITN